MKYIGLIILAIVSAHAGFAQEDDWRLYRPEGQQQPSREQQRELTETSPRPGRVQTRQGEISFQRDRGIAELDSLRKHHPSPMEGYRVQVFFGSRNEAQKLRGEFLRKYPDTPAYISYLAPNFRLRVGDFRSKMESEKFKKEISDDFPGSYIVKDEITLPALRTAEAEAE